MKTPVRLVSLTLAVAASLPGEAVARSPLVSTEPSLQPSFSRAVSDYAVRCPDRSLTVASRRAPGTRVRVGGRRSNEPRSVPIEPGQAISIVVRQGDRRTRHFVRCVPDDFPNWSYRAVGPQTPRWYLLTPGASLSSDFPARSYVAIFDHHGVPVWWYRSPTPIAHDARLIDGNVAYAEANPGTFGSQYYVAYRIRRLDGSLVHSVHTVGAPTDFHDLQRIGRDYLVLTYRPRPHVDLSAYGGPTDATVLDSEIQRIDPRGRLVWSWSSRDHISLAETGRWWPLVLNGVSLEDGSTAYDVTHINSVEPAGRDLIISLRHTDAVYRIRMRDGRIRWKLGGTETRRSLRVVGDPADYPLGGQHDARLWGDTITIHDNADNLEPERPPRAVRYAIDTKRRRATLLESLSDPHVMRADCCGSARKVENGDWLVGWGPSQASANSVSSLLTPSGSLVSRLTFEDHLFSYRVVPEPVQLISAISLRRGMDAMYAAGQAD